MKHIFFTPERWEKLWQRLGADSSPQGSFDGLLERYQEVHRRFHDSRHIDRCLLNFEALKSLAERPEFVEYSLWMHDAVYDTRAKDNELRSADLASALLRDAGLSHLIEPVREMILATIHDSEPHECDSSLVVDIDLASSIGSEADDYLAYTIGVREEYSWVSDADFTAGRIRVLQAFSSREKIFTHHPCRALWEIQARKNMSMELQRLQR